MKSIDIIYSWMSKNKSKQDALEILCDYIDYFGDHSKLSGYLNCLHSQNDVKENRLTDTTCDPTNTLTEEEVVFITCNGWKFHSGNCIYLPDIHNGYVVNGVGNIRKLLNNVRNRGIK